MKIVEIPEITPPGAWSALGGGNSIGIPWMLQGGGGGLISSTVVDFRVGRLLGVVFIGAVGAHERLDQVQQLGQTLEKRMVSVVLGSS